MPSHRVRVAVLLMLAVLLLAACGEEEELSAPRADVPPTETAVVEPSPTATSSPEPSPTPVEVEPTPTTAPADDRLSDRNEYGLLDAWMGGLERDIFAGGYIEHEPEHRYVLLFTRDGEEAVYRYVKPGSDLDEFIEVRPAAFSYSDLYAATGEVNRAFSDLGFFPPASSINVMHNRVELMVDDPERVAQMLHASGISLPESVELISGGGVLVSLNPPEDVPGVYIAIMKPQPPRDIDDVFWEFTGTLVLEDGCLWVAPGGNQPRALPIWSDSYRLQVVGEAIEVINSSGIVVARVGEPIYMNAPDYDPEYLDRNELYAPIPETCEPERVLEVRSIDPLEHQPDMAMREPGYAPFDLFSVQWPATFADAEALASRLPERIGDPGMERWIRDDGTGRLVIGYGPEDDPGAPKLTITDLTTGTYFPDFWNVNDLIASSLMQNTGLDNGFSEDTAWALEDTSITGRVARYGSVPVHALTWGTNEGKVLFVAMAENYEQLEVLVRAIVTIGQVE